VLDGPFRGSVAVQRGLLTRGQLYGPRYRRLLPDVYVLVGTKLDLTTRSRAAYLHVAPLDRVVALADRRSESVLETRLRLNLVLGGLPVPDVQYRVHDDYGFVLARVDLAYPSARLAIEYDGETHFTPTRSRADRQRDLTLADLGWHTMRLTYDDVDGDPPRTRQRVATLLQARTPRATPVQL
jgi:very-short-patch-repair endonuclease